MERERVSEWVSERVREGEKGNKQEKSAAITLWHTNVSLCVSVWIITIWCIWRKFKLEIYSYNIYAMSVCIAFLCFFRNEVKLHIHTTCSHQHETKKNVLIHKKVHKRNS